VVKHVDRCLSCLACMTMPSGLTASVDLARARIERDYERPWSEPALRAVLARVLPNPALFRWAMRLARLARPFATFIPVSGDPGVPTLTRRLRAMLALAPKSLPPPGAASGSVFAAQGERRGRVALLQGCAQSVLDPASCRALAC